MYSLKLNGFKTKKQAEEFIKWYEWHGEQEAAVWFEINQDKIGTDFMPVDTSFKYKWENNTLIAKLNIK